MIIIFSVFGLIFAILSIPLLIVANSVNIFFFFVISQAYEDVIIYDGSDKDDYGCHINENNEDKVCQVYSGFCYNILGFFYSYKGY